jgi:hypothetical protein
MQFACFDAEGELMAHTHQQICKIADRVFSPDLAINTRKAMTTNGHEVTGIESKRDAVTNRAYLFGLSWEPEANHYGCTGPQRWNMDGSIIEGGSFTPLTDWVGG